MMRFLGWYLLIGVGAEIFRTGGTSTVAPVLLWPVGVLPKLLGAAQAAQAPGGPLGPPQGI